MKTLSTIAALALGVSCVAFTAPAEAANHTELENLKREMMMMQKRIMQLEEQAEADKAAAPVKINGSPKSHSVVPNMIYSQPSFSDEMMDFQSNVTGKNATILKARQDGRLQPNNIYLGGAIEATAMFEKTNEPGKFPILSRFPAQHTGSSGSRGVINYASLSTTATIGDYVTAYAQMDYSEIEFSPAQDELQLRKAHITIGNLDKSPFYGYIGRNNIDFGDMDSYNPFTHTVNSHFFRAESDGPAIGLGYYDNGWDIIVTALNGERGLRVTDSDQHGHFSNFAINADKTFDLGTSSLRIGGGFLYGTIYRSDFTNHTRAAQAATPANTQFHRNPAWDAVVELITPRWDLMAEYTMTTDDWPATGEPVQAFTLQAAYKHNLFDRPSIASLVFSRGEQGQDGTEFEYADQIVVGYESQVWNNMYLGAEYVRNNGFTPLINITTDSDESVQTDTIIFGGRAVF